MEVNKKNAYAVARHIKSSVEAVLMAQAYAGTMRSAVDEIKAKILNTEPGWMGERGDKITEPKWDWLIADDTESKIYYEMVDEQCRAAGLIPKKEGNCVALEAEELQRIAERNLVKAAEKFFPEVTVDALLCSGDGLKTYKSYIDNLCGLVITTVGVNVKDFQKG